ncbi:MAG TPA: CPBP family intramembrane metalloprotease, partial [Mycobacterium sp.]|nr:CPBP family intramembrane metalloprotease [Mycobacterium sp.]
MTGIKFRGHPAARAILGTVLAAAARAPLGLRPPVLWSGLRVGGAAAAMVATGVAAATAVPRVRSAMVERDLPDRPARWLALEIPAGTVWAEEAVFRGAVQAVAARAVGRSGGRLLQAA